MPEGLPRAAELIGKNVTFFSLDTNVIQSLGYKFDVGALHKLALQRPEWMRLQLTEIVEREVKAHRMVSVLEAIQQLSSASDKLARASGMDMISVNNAFEVLNIERSASTAFDEQIKKFVDRLGGSVLPIEGPSLAKEMFSRYFEEHPPFESKKDKKFEFPDAAALLVLDEYARSNNTLGILVSNDTGWASFAKASRFLFCVKSLDDFTALFASEGANAETVKRQLRESLSDPLSPLARELERALGNHVEESSWTVGDLYSSGNQRLEGDVYESSLASYDIDLPGINVWFVDHDPSMCLVELSTSIKAKVLVSVEVFVWDSIDREELSIGSVEVTETTEFEVDVFLTYHGELLDQPPSEWEVDIEIADGDYVIDVGEVDPDFSDPD